MPPRRSGSLTGTQVAVIRSKRRSSGTTSSSKPSTHGSLNEAPTLLPCSTLSSESPKIAAGMLTSTNEELTSQSKDLSFVRNEAQEETLASSGLSGPDVSSSDATKNENTAVKFHPARIEDLIEGETSMFERGETRIPGKSGKKKVVKKIIKTVKVVKRMVPKKVLKGSLQTELVNRGEDAPIMIVHKHNENIESQINEGTSTEVENCDPIPVASDLIHTDYTNAEDDNLDRQEDASTLTVHNHTVDAESQIIDCTSMEADLVHTDNANLSKFALLETEHDNLVREEDAPTLIVHNHNEDVESQRIVCKSMDVETGDPIPVGSDLIQTDNTNLIKGVLLEAEDDNLKESIVDSTGVENVNPFSEDTMEGESKVSSEISTSGITLNSSSDDKRGVMGEEKIETQVESVGSFERDTREKFEDQSVVPVEDEPCVVESSGVGLNGLVSMSGEMEALERKRKRKTEVFLGGLDKGVKEEDIRKVFEQVGEVKEVRLLMDSKTGKNRGYGFLRFASAADCKEALTNYSCVEICGKKCVVRLVEGNDTIYLGNIDKKWKNDDVLELVKTAGVENIDCVTVMGDTMNSEQNRGFAFLEIETSREAQIAFKQLQNDFLIKQKKIAVLWAQPLIEPDEEEVLKVKAVYAEFLPSSWDEKKARGFFQRFGKIESITLAKNLFSSKRKDFAFVNYTSREDALACIEACNHDQLDDNGLKVTLKVSLAKPMTSTTKTRLASVSARNELPEAKPNILKPMLKVHESRNQGRPTSSSRNSIHADKRTSTNEELIHLLRKQASGGPSPAESYGFNHGYPLVGNKRPFSAVGNYPPSMDPRAYPRMRSETFHSTGDARSFGHPARMEPLPFPHQRNTSFTDEPGYGIQNYQHFQQMTGRVPYDSEHINALYRRY